MSNWATQQPAHNLVLIGGRGSGKSALTRRILRANCSFTPFVLDDLIRYEAGGRTIPEIVHADGWEHFRELEYQVVRKASAFPRGALLDCGGGVVVDLDADGAETYSERKVDQLRRHGLVIYLQRDVDYLLGRIQGDSNRPDLSASRSFAEIMARRDPWYRQAAHWVLECGTRSKRKLTQEILSWFFSQQAASPPP